MFANRANHAASNSSILDKLTGRSSKVRRKQKSDRTGRRCRMEGLERREMFAVSSLYFNGNTLVVQSDNNATSVTVSQSGSNYKITDVTTNRSWNYSASSVGSVEFRGGAGNDRFVNNAQYLSTRAYGNAGNDYLEGYNAVDWFVGGTGNDTLVGYGGNDHLNGGAGTDTIYGGNGDDTIISLDGASNDTIYTNAGNDTVWADSSDQVFDKSSTDLVQRVSSFANGADRTLDGDRIADPDSRLPGNGQAPNPNDTATRYARFDKPLFSSSGPSMNDITQGSVGDCWLLAGVSAIALDSPNAIRQNVVDFDDGTFGVRLGNSYYRVDNDLPIWNQQNGATNNNLKFAKLGAGESMWVAVVEKAFAHYRQGKNSYASLNGGWSIEVNRAFRSTSAGEKSIRSYASATALVNDIATRYYNYQAVTIGFVGNLVGSVPLIANHMYTVAGIARNAAGVVTSITLRNPHGAATSQFGVTVTLTPQQLFNQTGMVNWGRVA